MAVFDDDTGIVDVVAVVFGKPDDHDDAVHLAPQLVDRRFDTGPQSCMKQQVFRRITADAQLGEDDEIGTQLIASTRSKVDDLLRIASDVTDDEVDLGEREFQRLRHRRAPVASAAEHVRHLRAELGRRTHGGNAGRGRAP